MRSAVIRTFIVTSASFYLPICHAFTTNEYFYEIIFRASKESYYQIRGLLHVIRSQKCHYLIIGLLESVLCQHGNSMHSAIVTINNCCVGVLFTSFRVLYGKQQPQVIRRTLKLVEVVRFSLLGMKEIIYFALQFLRYNSLFFAYR